MPAPCSEVRAGGEAGFTLLELLAALTVLGILMAMMFGGLRFGARVWESGDQGLRGLAELQTASGFIRRQIAQAIPVDAGWSQQETARAGFRGTERAVRLVGPAPSQFLPGGLYEMVFGISDADTGSRDFSVWWRPLARADEVAAVGIEADWRTRQAVLVEGVSEVRISYFGRGEEMDEEPRWHERWDTMTLPPALVSVRIAFPPGDRRFWPDLVVAPMTSPAY
ncbi:MAG: prepilin-type N-terminal cleavage/methylation domain-containing protein [Rhodospirillales bacterium]|jgi:general secretion pathway protein J|nr:prepilin-type N-terminal cleavage/methylation domain-containing protein [Rhodospirillales bacterium]